MVLAFLKSSCLSSGDLESSHLDVLLLANKTIPSRHKVLALDFSVQYGPVVKNPFHYNICFGTDLVSVCN